MVNRETVAAQLRAHRAIAYVSQGDLAENIGASVNSVSSWEQGKTLPDVLVLAKIADYYGVSLDQLTGHEVMAKED